MGDGPESSAEGVATGASAPPSRVLAEGIDALGAVLLPQFTDPRPLRTRATARQVISS
jgi:hypothetical protein